MEKSKCISWAFELSIDNMPFFDWVHSLIQKMTGRDVDEEEMEQLPEYEISPKRILLFQCINFILLIAALYLAYVYEIVPAKYQEICDNLKPVIDRQNKLHAICWYLMWIGVPKVSAPGNQNNNDNEDEKKSNEPTIKSDVDKLPESKVENESVFSTSDDDSDMVSDSDSDSDSSFSDFGENDIIKDNDKPSEMEKQNDDSLVLKGKSEQNVEAQTNIITDNNEKANAKPTENFEEILIKAECNIKNQTSDKNSNIENNPENLQLQLAQMKAENEKLKNSLEKLFATQNIA
uniref:Uncharacterized protein n=1 Tax=Panagrolaimus superbus TaxID=310955 RepID=A0A914YG51_9BILA